MKKTIKLFILLLSSFVIVAADNEFKEKENALLKVELVEQIKIKNTKNIKARFISVKDKAIELGIQDIYINGNITYKKNGNYQDLNFMWTTLEDVKLNKSNYATLDGVFKSSLTTNENIIHPPQEIIIEVDKAVLMKAINKLNEKNQPVATKVSLDDTSVAALKDGGYKQDSSNSSNNSNASALPQVDKLTNEKTEASVVNSCAVRYDIANLKAYKQERTDTVDSKGTVIKTGTCRDTNSTYQLEKKYGAPCTPLVDQSKEVVYQAYRVVNSENTAEIAQDCKHDLKENTIAIEDTTSGCGIEHDINAGKSYQKSQKYYDLDGTKYNVTSCAKNNTEYIHTKQVCNYNVNLESGVAIPQVKITANVNGSTMLVQECTTDSSINLTMFEQECQGNDRYDHDLAAAVSYLKKAKYVKDPFTNQNAKVNNCQRSATTFQHQQVSTGCDPVYDDSNLAMRQPVKKIFADGANTVEVASCQGGTDVNYVYINEIWKLESKSQAKNVYYFRSETNPTARCSGSGQGFIIQNNTNPTPARIYFIDDTTISSNSKIASSISTITCPGGGRGEEMIGHKYASSRKSYIDPMPAGLNKLNFDNAGIGITHLGVYAQATYKKYRRYKRADNTEYLQDLNQTKTELAP